MICPQYLPTVPEAHDTVLGKLTAFCYLWISELPFEFLNACIREGTSVSELPEETKTEPLNTETGG